MFGREALGLWTFERFVAIEHANVRLEHAHHLELIAGGRPVKVCGLLRRLRPINAPLLRKKAELEVAKVEEQQGNEGTAQNPSAPVLSPMPVILNLLPREPRHQQDGGYGVDEETRRHAHGLIARHELPKEIERHDPGQVEWLQTSDRGQESKGAQADERPKLRTKEDATAEPDDEEDESDDDADGDEDDDSNGDDSDDEDDSASDEDDE